jgi:hypothetical protein
LRLEADARKLQARATALGYALAGEVVPPGGEDYFAWQISRLDAVFANCEKKFAALAGAPQKWVVLDLGSPGMTFAVDVSNIRTVGARRAISVMIGFGEALDGGDGQYFNATVDTFSFDCTARGTAQATMQILFDTEFEQVSLAPTADSFPYGPNDQLAGYERIACGDVALGNDAPSAPDMAAAAKMTSGFAALD